MSTLTFAMSPYLGTSLLNHVLRNTSLTSCSGWLGLYIGNPRTSGTEVLLGTSNGYSRVQVPFTISGSVAKNTSTITFPKATDRWGTISYIGISDASTSGNLLFYGQIPTTDTKTVYKGNIFFVDSEELIIELGGAFSVYLANNLLNHVLNKTTYTSPALDVFAALYSTVPDRSDSGGTEISAADYTRLRISGSSWSTPVNRVIAYSGDADTNDSGAYISLSRVYTSNLITLDFCTDTQYVWGEIKGICLRDAASGGNQLFGGSFDYPSVVIAGDGYNIKISDLIVENG